MSGVRILPSRLSGQVAALPSKSMSHRLAICAALSGKAIVENLNTAEDVMATVDGLRALGYDLQLQKSTLIASGQGIRQRIIDCVQSGTTLRLLFPLALDGIPTTFVTRGRLKERPMGEYRHICMGNGILFEKCDEGIHVCGKLRSGEFRLRGDVSSQFVSGMLLALSRLDGDSTLMLTTPLQSRDYVALTLQAMHFYGVTVDGQCDAFSIKGGQRYRGATVVVEGDWSHAANFLVAGAIAGDISCYGLDRNSKQGDKAIIEILRAMGGYIEGKEQVSSHHAALHGTVVDVAQTPDIVPIVCVAACAAQGNTHIINASRLRFKESDRLSEMVRCLTDLGADIRAKGDEIFICGTGRLRGGKTRSRDHRVVMALSVSAAICDMPVLLEDTDAVNKSAPCFFHEFEQLGGRLQYI